MKQIKLELVIHVDNDYEYLRSQTDEPSLGYCISTKEGTELCDGLVGDETGFLFEVLDGAYHGFLVQEGKTSLNS